jgi:hypothetical protein
VFPLSKGCSISIKGRLHCHSNQSNITRIICKSSEDLRRLFVNATYSLTGLEVPKKADVSPVGIFEPSTFGFNTFKKSVKVESHELK